MHPLNSTALTSPRSWAWLLAGMFACVSARHASSSSPASPAAGTGEVRGVVRDSSSRRPILAAQLQLLKAKLDGDLLVPDTGPSATAMADSLGRFVFPRVLPGQYLLLARMISYRGRVTPVLMRPDTLMELTIDLPPIPCPDRVLNC